MINYPNFDPNAISFGAFSIKWYGICYLVAFLLCYWQAIKKNTRELKLQLNNEQIADLFFYLSIGVIFGGRIGYILFYAPMDIIDHPITLLQFWLPGRSFHGGLLGVIIAILYYAKKNRCFLLKLTDFIAPIVPIGIACGRIGNFINGELWGRVTSMPWGMIFSHVDNLPRHPSQLYEFFLEGIMLYLILNLKYYKNKSAWFLIFYGLFRIFVENYREPDVEQYFIADIAHITMGQMLSIPMLLIGISLLIQGKFKIMKIKEI